MRRFAAPVLSTLCLAWCVVIGCVIWWTPVRYSGFRNGAPAVIDRSFSEVSGYGPLPLIIPACVAALGTWGAWRDRRLLVTLSGILLALFTFIAGFSIGGAYLPASGLQILAAVLGAFLGSGRSREQAAAPR